MNLSPDKLTETDGSSVGIMKAFLAASAAISVFFAYILFKSPLFRQIQEGKRINVLLIGADNVQGGSHADVILWISYQPLTRFIDVVSIPRDALIKWERWIPRKLSEILYGNTKKHGMEKGINYFKAELENFLNVNFDYHIIITFTAFAHFIDALGRIPVQIDQPMHYDDNWGNLHIHFEPGQYLLNGEDSLKYVRYRHSTLGDLGRIKRQHLFLKSLLAEAIGFRTFLAVPRFLKILKEDIFTNISSFGIIPLLEIIRTSDVSNQRYQILPGVSQTIVSKDVWKLDQPACIEVKNTVFNSHMELWPRTKLRPFLLRRGPKSLDGIQAEVFNATEKGGLSEKLTNKFRECGSDIVMWGNWGSYQKHTEVIARGRDFSKAVRVARVLGCSHIRTDIDSNRMVDVSVVIGSDFPVEFLDESK